MAIQVTRKEHESFLSMLRRFNRRVKASKHLLEARSRRFHLSKPTKRQQRLSAIHKAQMKKQYEKLKKLGKLPQPKKRR
ncbi:30S ribosomal protein S21 [Candidatus Parcubacteria bacterium]|nr:MAG: 30S ribosomal protein S21 [Candidatus Parcubacteria bacterium]